MEEETVKTIPLENGLVLKICDASRKVTGDRWRVRCAVSMEIPVRNLEIQAETGAESEFLNFMEQAGETLTFENSQERFFVDDGEKDSIFKELSDSILESGLSYYSRKDFAARYVMKQYRDFLKQKALTQM